jgi:hypothetical protein
MRCSNPREEPVVAFCPYQAPILPQLALAIGKPDTEFFCDPHIVHQMKLVFGC